jgi:apolipoprotein N-acyltransferase
MYVFILVSSYKTGEQRRFYFLLAQITLFFLGWGISLLLSGKTLRDIAKHLTEEERAESTRLARSYGGKMGLFVVGLFTILFTWLRTMFDVRGILPYAGLFCIVMVLAAPFIFRHRKKMKDFMFSTEYAREQGYNKEPANVELDSISKGSNTSL